MLRPKEIVSFLISGELRAVYTFWVRIYKESFYRVAPKAQEERTLVVETDGHEYNFFFIYY